MLIYQILVRLFGNTNSEGVINGTLEQNGVGKFAYLNDKALNSFKQLGITHLWLTGILEHASTTSYPNILADSTQIVKGEAGSPYAIRDYYNVCPDLALNPENRLKEFEETVKYIHEKGLKVIIDFIPNHLSRNYCSKSKPDDIEDFGENDNKNMFFSPDNNFYYLSDTFESPVPPTLGIKPYEESPAKVTANNVFKINPKLNDWFEVVKLNYGVNLKTQQTHFDPIPNTWYKMRDILLFWADKGIDGWRCDMVEMVPIEFWSWIITEVRKQYPALYFIAETYEPKYYRKFIKSGFDYLYDKIHFYDGVRKILQEQSSCDILPAIWQNLEGINDKMLRFLENHDEQRLASKQYCGDGNRAFPAVCLNLTFHHKASMMYFGQEFGEKATGKSGFSQDDGRTTIFDYWQVPSHARWFNNGQCNGDQLYDNEQLIWNKYKKLLTCYRKYEALQNGLFFDLHYFNRNINFSGYTDSIYAYLKYNTTQKLLIILNFSKSSTHILIKIPLLAFESMQLDIHNNYSLTDQLFSNKTLIFNPLNIIVPHNNEGIAIEIKSLGTYIFLIETFQKF